MTLTISTRTVGDDFFAEMSCEEQSRSAHLIYSAFLGCYSGELICEGMVCHTKSGPCRGRDEAWSLVGRLADWCGSGDAYELPDGGPKS